MAKESLLDPKSMDGPAVKWTVADLFASNANVAMTYHVMGAGYDALTPVGTLLGGAIYAVGYRPMPALAFMGTTGLLTGTVGMALGLTGMMSTARKGEKATPLPWNEEGVQQRVDGLKHNFKVRILDKSVWYGIGMAGGALLFAGGPAKLGLSKGPLGVAQALSLGSAIGGLSAFGCIYATLPKKDDDDSDDE